MNQNKSEVVVSVFEHRVMNEIFESMNAVTDQQLLF